MRIENQMHSTDMRQPFYVLGPNNFQLLLFRA